ncbi:MAG: ABC transporter ATP-binding protein [Deltaproteobacteria bacterium]|nr:ABC transporter ATP-binding protein [Deltaproteobacteria bacterium]
MDLIAFQHVDKRFGAHRVLVDANIAIRQGETLTVIGGSGTGKSVFLKLLLGILRPERGRILFRGKNVPEMSERELIEMRRHIGMLFQGSALFDSLTVAENVAYPLRVHFDYSEAEREHIVQTRLEMVGLAGIEKMMPADLSGGMRKRVGLARAIATEPDVILYDEPTTGLDPANTKRIARLIQELQQKLRATSIIVTHDMDFAFSVTDRVAMLHQKRFAFVGTKDEAMHSDNPVVQDFIHGELESAST